MLKSILGIPVFSVSFALSFDVLCIRHFTYSINKQTNLNFEHIFSDCLRGLCNVCVGFLSAFLLHAYIADNKNT